MIARTARLIRTWTFRLRKRHISWPRQLGVGQGAKVIISNGGTLLPAGMLELADRAFIEVKGGELKIGSRSFIGIGTVIVCREAITIGDDALIAEYVTIRDQDHRFDGLRPTREIGFDTAPIRIGRNVWIGAKATITKGVTIGDNVVIAAGAVVTRDVPGGVVAAGVPARVLGTISEP